MLYDILHSLELRKEAMADVAVFLDLYPSQNQSRNHFGCY
jgi:hypothetical protein